MKKFLLFFTMFTMLILTGCSENSKTTSLASLNRNSAYDTLYSDIVSMKNYISQENSNVTITKISGGYEYSYNGTILSRYQINKISTNQLVIQIYESSTVNDDGVEETTTITATFNEDGTISAIGTSSLESTTHSQVFNSLEEFLNLFE